MKKFFQTAMIGLLSLAVACNDGENASENDNRDSDTTANATTDNSNTNSVMTKNGLPLGPNQEVPPNDSKASGTADVSYNRDSKMLVFTVNYNDLTGEPSMAHIHGPAAKGANAGVVHDLSKLLQKAKAGSFSDSVKVDGSSIKEDSLLSGFYYFNIHTPKHPAGEIRGQIEF
jgi:hypothetical protein